jgi:DoxX-like protein
VATLRLLPTSKQACWQGVGVGRSPPSSCLSPPLVAFEAKAVCVAAEKGSRETLWSPYLLRSVRWRSPPRGVRPLRASHAQARLCRLAGPWIGLSLLVSTILYAVPRTAVLGAILLTGYLGGAVATQVRVGDPWFLFPAVMGALAWAGLWCRNPQIRELLPSVR